MNSTLKNSLMFVGIGVILVLVYVFVIKKDDPESNLTTSSNIPITNTDINSALDNENIVDIELSQQILTALSNVKSISLEDSIFSSIAFKSLVDGTIPLVPDKDEGRPNPFAPIGVEGSSFNTNTNLNTDLNSFQAPSIDLDPNVSPLSEVLNLEGNINN